MKLSFEAEIYKVGINPCVDVPAQITERMQASKGYIRVRGKINSYSFRQTLVPVKNSDYRLYVNGMILKGSNSKVGDTVSFEIEQDPSKRVMTVSMPETFKNALRENGLFTQFKHLVPSRQKGILLYLNNLKTEKSLLRNISKVVAQLKKKVGAEKSLCSYFRISLPSFLCRKSCQQSF